MNAYDQEAMLTIQHYIDTHIEYPQFIEATPELLENMTCKEFVFLDGPLDTSKEIRIPIVAVGTCDIVFRRLLVRNTDINQKRAEYATHEEFHRVGAKLARAGLTIVEPKETCGLQTYNPHLFFHQIIAYVFGEQAALEEAMTNHSHEEQ